MSIWDDYFKYSVEFLIDKGWGTLMVYFCFLNSRSITYSFWFLVVVFIDNSFVVNVLVPDFSFLLYCFQWFFIHPWGVILSSEKITPRYVFLALIVDNVGKVLTGLIHGRVETEGRVPVDFLQIIINWLIISFNRKSCQFGFSFVLF